MDVLKSIGLVSLTTLLSLVVLFLLTKLMGAKQVSQMTMFDYVEGITIGSVAAELATNLDAPLNSLTALVLYGLAAVGISSWTSHSLTARRVLTGKPLVLLENGVIKNVKSGVKILGNGKLTKKLTVKANKFSASAVKAIEAAGGKTEVM